MHLRQKKIIKGLAIIFSVGLLILLAITVSHYPAAPLRWEPEGLYHSYNFRDVGASLNECSGRHWFREGLLTRSNKYFSGWDCQGIGNPERIITLNYDPTNNYQYYCRHPTGNIVGRFYNATMRIDEEQLYQLESWQQPAFREGMCSFVRDMLESLAQGRRQHVHCSAGRDRTGSLIAMVAAALVPAELISTQQFAELAECDYRKSKNLAQEKHGNISRLLAGINLHNGSTRQFLIETCTVSPELVQEASRRFCIFR